MYPIKFLLLLLSLAAFGSKAADFEDAVNAFEQGNYAEAYPLLLDASEKNIFNANTYILYLYDKRNGLKLGQVPELSTEERERLERTQLAHSHKELAASVLMASINELRKNPSKAKIEKFPKAIDDLIDLSTQGIPQSLIILGKLALEKNNLLRDFITAFNKLLKNNKNEILKKTIFASLQKIQSAEKYFLTAAFFKNKISYKYLCQLHTSKKITLSSSLLNRCLLAEQEHESGSWEELVINAPDFEAAEKEIFRLNAKPAALCQEADFLQKQKAKWRISQALSGNAAAFERVATAAFNVERITTPEEEMIAVLLPDFAHASFRDIVATSNADTNNMDFKEAIGEARCSLGRHFEVENKNFEKAYYWYKKSAETGCQTGIFNEAAFGVFIFKEVVKALSEDETYELALKYYNILFNEAKRTKKESIIKKRSMEFLVRAFNEFISRK